MRLFLDASALIALADRSDRWHAAAKRFLHDAGQRSRLYTSFFVLDETATRLRSAAGAAAAARAVGAVLASRRCEVLEIDRALVLEALTMLGELHEHRLSLTDCTSFLLMRRLALSDAFTFDAGFVRLGFRMHPVLPGA